MKKSNKLLLGGFLTGLLLITALHVTLYAKYKAGDYTVYRAEDDRTPGSVQLIPNILFVSVRNVPEATVKYSEVAEVKTREEDGTQYVRKGDTLLITGTENVNQGESSNRVAFNLPYNATLSVFNSSLFFKTGKKTAESNTVIYLNKSQAFFSGTRSPLRLGRVKVIATDGSTAAFQGDVRVDTLDVQLSNSSIDYTEGNVGQLSIVTDSLSRISLQSKHLVKASIKPIAPK